MLVNDEPTSPRRTFGAGRLIALAILVLVVGLAAWRGWAWWQARGEGQRDEQAMTVQRLEALEARAEALRRDQRAQAQRLLDAAATNRVLRDEVLGLGQRGALLEESVAKLTDPDRHGAQALRLDEVELLLSLAAQRLEIAHDPAGARRAYALAAGVLDGLDDLIKTVGFLRDLNGRLSCITALGSALWDRFQAGRRPKELRPFAPIKGAKHTAPATPGSYPGRARGSLL